MASYGTVSPGTPHRQAIAGGFVITETSYAPLARLAPHAHEQPSLTLVMRGGFRERIGRASAELARASLLVKPGDTGHADDIGARGARILFIEPTPERLRDLTDAEPLLRRVAHVVEARIGRLGWRLWSEPWDGDAVSALRAEALVLEILAMARRAIDPRPAAPPPWLRALRDRLAESFLLPPSLTALALEAGVRPSHFARAFRQHYGMRPADFVQQQRIAAAKHMLLHTDRSLAQIAAETGFSDQSHFGRVFRYHAGVTPAEFRRARGA